MSYIWMAYNNWPVTLAGVVGLVAIIGLVKGWVSPSGSASFLFWALIYLSPPMLFIAGYLSPRLHRAPKLLMDDPTAFVAGGMGPVVALGVAYLGALFVAGGSERASLARLMSYLMVTFVWTVGATATAVHVFDTMGPMMWSSVPAAFTLVGAAVTIFVVSRNAWQRSPAEHHRSLS